MTNKLPYNQVAAPPVVLTPRKYRPLGGTQGSNKTWMISFTDIMGLMLTFFVLIYAMSERELQKAPSVSASQIENPGAFAGTPLAKGDSDVVTLPRKAQRTGLDLSYLQQILRNKQQEVPELALIQVAEQGANITLTIPLGVVISNNNSQTVRPDIDPLLEALADFLSTLNNQVELMIAGPDLNVAAGLQTARTIHTALTRLGYRHDMPLMVNQTVAGEARFVIRITPMQRRAG